jgi:hypothetical protein
MRTKALLLAAALFVTVPARAQQPAPTASDFATARTALKEGLALRDKGDLQAAAARMQTAYDLVKTPVTAFELGKTQLMLGHVLTAHELFQVVVRMPPALEESARSAAARTESAKLSADIEPRIPVLRIHVKLEAGASAVVRVDDDVIHTSGEVTERAVDPGPHEIVAKAGDGPEEKINVDVKEAEKKDVELAPKWVAPKPPPPVEKEVVYVRQTNPLTFIGFVGASAGLVATTVFTIVAVNNANRADEVCGSHTYCSQDNRQKYVLPAQLTGGLAWVSAAATVGFGVMGIVGVNTPIRERVTAYVGPGSAGLTGSF